MWVADLSVSRLKKAAGGRDESNRYIRSRLWMRRAVAGAKNGPALPEVFWQPFAKPEIRAS